MKKAFAGLMALVVLSLSGAASAAEWVPLPAAGAADQYFYDRSKLTIKDDEITYWKKVVFKVPQPLNGKEAASGLLRERIDCAEHTAKLVSYLYYSSTNETIDYVAQYESEPSPIIPDTVGDAFERVLCPMVWHKQEENRLKAEQKAASAELAGGGKEERKPDPKSVEIKPAKTKSPPQVIVVPQQTPPANDAAKQAESLKPLMPTGPIPLPQIIEQLY